MTKLLLGGGLTQLERFPTLFRNWGKLVAYGVTGAKVTVDIPPPAGDEVFATALIIYFLVLGFLGGYLITKIELGPDLGG